MLQAMVSGPFSRAPCLCGFALVVHRASVSSVYALRYPIIPQICTNSSRTPSHMSAALSAHTVLQHWHVLPMLSLHVLVSAHITRRPCHEHMVCSGRWLVWTCVRVWSPWAVDIFESVVREYGHNTTIACDKRVLAWLYCVDDEALADASRYDGRSRSASWKSVIPSSWHLRKSSGSPSAHFARTGVEMLQRVALLLRCYPRRQGLRQRPKTTPACTTAPNRTALGDCAASVAGAPFAQAARI